MKTGRHGIQTIAFSKQAIHQIQARFAAAVAEATLREDGPLLYVRIDPVDAASISYCLGCVVASEFLHEQTPKRPHQTKAKRQK